MPNLGTVSALARSWPRSLLRIVHAARPRRSSTRSCVTTWRRSCGMRARRTAHRFRVTCRTSFAATFVAASSPTGSFVRIATRAGTIFSSRSPAKGAASARVARGGAWRTRRRTWSIGCSPRYPCASGSCPPASDTPNWRDNARGVFDGEATAKEAESVHAGVQGGGGPFELRRLAAFDAKVLATLARVFAEALSERYRRWGRGAGSRSSQTGSPSRSWRRTRRASAGTAARASTARFDSVASRLGKKRGRALDSGAVRRTTDSTSMHLNVVVLDGVFVRDEGGSATFHSAPPPSKYEIDAVLARVLGQRCLGGYSRGSRGIAT